MYRRDPDAPDDWSALLWPDRKTGPWMLRLLWADVRGRRECVGIELRCYREDDEQWPPLPTKDETPQVLSTSILRRLRLGEIVDDIRRTPVVGAGQLARWFEAQGDQPPSLGVGQPTTGGRTAAELAEAFRRAEKHLAKKLAKNDDDTHAEVARVYLAAWRDGRHPTQAVADHFVISHSAAAKRVSRARDAHALPRTSQGRAGIDSEEADQ